MKRKGKQFLIVLTVMVLVLCSLMPAAMGETAEKVLRVPGYLAVVPEDKLPAFQAAVEAAFAQRQPDVRLEWVEPHGETDVWAVGSGLYPITLDGKPVSSAAALTPYLYDLTDDADIAANLAQYVDLSAVYGDGAGAVYCLPWQVQQSPWRVLDAEAASAVGWTRPQARWLWSDVFELCDTVAAYNAENETEWKAFYALYETAPLLRQAWVRDGEAADETAVALAAQWRDVADAGLVMHGQENLALATSSLQPAKQTTLLCQMPLDYTGFTSVLSDVLPTPAFAEGEAALLPIDNAGYAVPKDSPCLEWALDFLACLSDPQFIGAFAQSDLYVLHLGYLLTDAQGVLNTPTRTVVREDGLTAWQTLFAQGRGWRLGAEEQAQVQAALGF